MAKMNQIEVEFRDVEGKGASRRLRASGKVPAVIYGGKEKPRNLQIDGLKAYIYSQKEWFYTSILELKAGNETQKVLLRDIQRHPYQTRLLHLDFQRVSETEKLRLRVPLHFLNQEKSPAGKISGVLILHELNDVEIYCLPKHLPEFIEIDLIELKEGDTVHLSDLKLPANVEIPALKLGKEHDVAVVVARMAHEEVEPVADAAVAGAVPAAAQKADAKAPAKGAAPTKGAAPAAGGKAAPAKAAPAKAPEKKK
jgi:large subunit ribosomal protein L25